MAAETIIYIIVLCWGIITTCYGLWLSRQNNLKYNKRIVEMLEKIEQNTRGANYAKEENY